MEDKKTQEGATKTPPPGVEAIVRRYETPSHPFEGPYTRISEPVEVMDRIPGDIRQLCLAAKKHFEARTYAFFEGHRYELSSLKHVMDLDYEVKRLYDRKHVKRHVLLKAAGHGPASRDAVIDVYHAFVGDPEKAVETFENGDS